MVRVRIPRTTACSLQPLQPPRMITRKFLKKPLISLAVLVLMLLVGEGLVRAFTNVEPPLVMRDALLGRRFVPSFEAQVFDKESQLDILVRTNSDGFRTAERSATKGANTRRIAIIGDSMVAALAVEEEQTMTMQLEGLLKSSHPETDWQVMNFGVPGSGTGQECLVYEEIVREYSPDLVLACFFSGNDLADNHRGLTSNPRIYFDLDEQGNLIQLPFSVSRTGSSRWLNQNSRLYVWQKQLFRGVKLKQTLAGPAMRQSDWVFAEEPTEAVERAWEITTALFSRFKASVEQDGAEFCLVHIPGGKQIYANAFEGTVAQAGEHGASFVRHHPDTKLQALSERIEAHYVSLTPVLRSAAPSDTTDAQDEWLFFNGGGHWNVAGNATAARGLHEFLTNSGSADRSLVERLRDN